jgi:uncharacterized membrane protein YkoI
MSGCAAQGGAMSRTLALLVLLAPLTPIPVRADEDHDRARAALERGEVLPLTQILSILELAPGTQLLEVELERENGVLVYEFDVIARDGRITEMVVDAATGAILGNEIGMDDD